MTKLISALPKFYVTSKHLVNTFRVAIQIDQPVDGEILRRAVDTAMRRYPYFSVKMAVENEEYVLLPNDFPIVITHGIEPICLGSEEANYHLVAFTYEGEIICLDCFHGLTDGTGIFPLFKTILYYYLCEREQAVLDPEGIHLADSRIPSEEIDDPYPESISEDIQPLGASKSVQQFRLPERTGPHASEWTAYHIQVKESDFMKYSGSHDASPAALTSALLYKTIQDIHPETELPIVCGMAHNIRKELGKPLAHQSQAMLLHLKYPASLKDSDITKLCTCTRGMIMVQSQPENILAWVRNNLRLIGHLKEMTHAEKCQFMQSPGRGLGSDTFNVSYVGRIDWGALESYIQAVHTYIDVAETGIMVEINVANGFFDFCFQQEFSEDIYVKRFMELLEMAEIPAVLSGPKPLLVSETQLDGA